MKSRVLGVAIAACLATLLTGPEAQAASSNATRFVRVLLTRESKLISTDRVAIATQNKDLQKLELLDSETPTARIRRMIAQLTKTVDKLQTQINTTTHNLVGVNAQVNVVLAGIPTPNPFTNLAASNAAIITMLAARPPFGIPPVTGSK